MTADASQNLDSSASQVGCLNSDRDMLLELALRSQNAGFLKLTFETQDIFSDPKFQELLEIPSNVTTPTLSELRQRIHPADYSHLVETVRGAIQSGEPSLTAEFRVTDLAKGAGEVRTLRWLLLTAQLRPGRMIGIVRDITPQKQMAEQAKESRTKINTLLNCVPQLIWTTTATGQHIYANGRCLSYSGFDGARRNLGWIHSIHPDDAKEVIGKWNTSITSGEIFEAEFRLRDVDGVDTWFLGRAVPLKDEMGRVTEWFGTATDIHEKKLAEARRNRIQRKVFQLQSIATALAVAHKPLEVAQLVVDQGLSVVDATSAYIVLTDPRSEKLALLYARGFSSNQIDDLNGLHIGDETPAAEAVRTRDVVFDRDRGIASLPLIVQGQALGALTFGYEVDQKFSDECVGYLNILADQCAQAIERARLFEAEQTARRRAEVASRAKTQFLTNMSHEIRTPMNSILGFADMLGDKSLTEKEREDYRNRIRMNGDTLMRLIDDVLDLTKAENGKIQVTNTKFSIIDLVRDIHDSMAPVTRKKEILTRITTDASVPHVIESDSVRLRQILTNLIGNSIKFTDHGRIETRISVEGTHLLVEVEDTGIGISPELHQRLFQPFVQGDSSVTRRFGGSGLGLVVSRSVAEAMGGTLDLVRSDSGRGSIFRLVIPLPARSLDPQINMFDPELPLLKPRRELEGTSVLLVEDSVDNEMLIRAYLKGTGVELEVAHNGKEALDCARDKNFDVVFMDIQMPVMDGLEATRQLKNQHYDRPIVALSAHALPEEVERSIAAGCHSHLTKPIMRNVLIDQIRNLRQFSAKGEKRL